MGEVVLRGPLAVEIQREAESEGLSVEALVEAALRHYRFQAQHQKIDAEAEWWRSVASEVRAKYKGEYVAVHDREVVDHDRDEDALFKRVRAKFGKVAVLITPADGQPVLRIVSTRLERP